MTMAKTLHQAEPKMPRFALRDLFMLIAFVAIALAGYRWLWQPPPGLNARIYLAVYLAVLAFATLAAFVGQPKWRRPCQGFAAFGWLNLVFVLWGGFWLSEHATDSLRAIQGVRLGFVLGTLVAIASACLLPEAGNPNAQ